MRRVNSIQRRKVELLNMRILHIMKCFGYCPEQKTLTITTKFYYIYIYACL